MNLSDLKSLPAEVIDLNKSVIERFLSDYMSSKSSIHYAYNKKKGTKYIIKDLILNCTNSQDGQVLVLYSAGGKFFAREISEFLVKFNPRIENET